MINGGLKIKKNSLRIIFYIIIMPYKRSYRKPPARKRFYKKKLVKKQTVKQIVKKELARQIENKTGATTGLFGMKQDAQNTIQNAFQLLPSIQQNASESGRIGNTIKMKNVYLRGILRYQPNATLSTVPLTPSQYLVRIFIGRLKQSLDVPSVVQFPSLLRTGSATLAFDSTDGLSLCRRVNKELFTVYYDKIFKLGTAAPSNNTATYNILTGMSNNDYKLNHMIKINLTKYVKQTWIYNDNATGPSNTALYMWGGLVDAMTSDAISGTSVYPVALDFDIEYSYEDA